MFYYSSKIKLPLVGGKVCFLILLLLPTIFIQAQVKEFPLVIATEKACILYDPNALKLDSITAYLLADDIESVTDYRPKVVSSIAEAKGNVIVIGQIAGSLLMNFITEQSDFAIQLNGKWECFGFKLVEQPTNKISKAYIIAGSDARGMAYGVFELSKRIGVSPWYWWADVKPSKNKHLTVAAEEFVSKPPAVKYRGIFINDEDWGLQPWAAKTFEPETGDIGPKTYAKVFELLLRLKANLIWPAMHPSTRAFFHYPGNIVVADNYQIVISSSHTEPMLRNNVGEWDEKIMGHFNYFTNKKTIYQYWEERINASRNIHAIYSLGMRGVHDGQMEGIKNLKDAVPVVDTIIQDERAMLSRNLGKDIKNIPQVLTPYKEVLDIYNYGLKVPDDVTLLWPDDNYGYIHRLNNQEELKREGGAGVYYHASYWGRPHDYLWLPSTHPSLMREEMMKAYETEANSIWVLNVGDIKPQEYNIQEFMDMAYEPEPFKNSTYSRQHLSNWAGEMFGVSRAKVISDILWKYYQLAFERKPEFMGWSQTEPNTKIRSTSFNHFYYGDEAQQRIDSYDAIAAAVKQLRYSVNKKDKDAFYELVYYPVVSAAWMNQKFLYRDKAFLYDKQQRLSAQEYAQLSKAAYDSIVMETAYYNHRLANGKWQYMMSMNPRSLDVYQQPDYPTFDDAIGVSWNIAPEGWVTKDSSLINSNNTDSLFLPSFDQFNRQRYFIDVFICKNMQLNWIAQTSDDWIRLSANKGSLNAVPGKMQQRIWVDIDWARYKANKGNSGKIVFTNGNQQYIVYVKLQQVNEPRRNGNKVFVENNGVIVMYATGYTHAAKGLHNEWEIIKDFGYTGNVLQASPATVNQPVFVSEDSIRQYSAAAAYEFVNHTATTASVMLYAIPTHPINNNFNVRYALSVDDGPINIVDIKTVGRSEEWKQNVLRNRAERKIVLPYLPAGKHSLKIYAIDPGVMLDEIRIDLGGLKSAYGGLQQTVLK